MNHLCARIAKERNCAPELVQAIATDFVAAMHEASFKVGIGQTLFDAHSELSDEGAWHFMGLLTQAAKCEPGEIIEHYKRLDWTLKRFASITERWQFELEQQREREAEERKLSAERQARKGSARSDGKTG